ncbi:hypothetical protein, partial [Salmonella phage vB_SalS_TU03]
NKNR